jgi:hypothetical protein
VKEEVAVLNSLPPGWDEQRIRGVLEHYEHQSDEDAAAEDQTAFEAEDETLMAVPLELVPAVREMIGLYEADKQLRRNGS